MARYVKLAKVGDAPVIKGLRAMEVKDIPEVTKMLNKYLSKFALHISFTEEEIRHFLIPREWVIETYVVEEDEKLTDLVSFYSLPSQVLRHESIKILNIAYSFYNVPGKYSLTELISDALIIAKNKGYDVFNALDVQQNSEVFKELKFAIGDGNLHYYLYNWRVHKLEPKELGIVLV